MDNNLIINKMSIEEDKDVLFNKINELIDIVNLKTNGIYSTLEFDTGKVLFADPSVSSVNDKPVLTRNIFCKCVNIGGLKNAGTSQEPHGIDVNANLIFIDVYGCATNPGVMGIKLPYASATLINNVEIWADATDVYVKTAKNMLAYTTCYAFLEYIKI